MLSCRQLHNIIVDSNQLWMCKFSQRCGPSRIYYFLSLEWVFLCLIPQVANIIQHRKNVNWRNWVSLRLRLVKEVKSWVSYSYFCWRWTLWTGMECRNVSLSFDSCLNSVEFYKSSCIFFRSEQFTLTHYTNVVLEKLRIIMQERKIWKFSWKNLNPRICF